MRNDAMRWDDLSKFGFPTLLIRVQDVEFKGHGDERMKDSEYTRCGFGCIHEIYFPAKTRESPIRII
jgi:hypothetical protein